jgi:hypothetical protein
MRGAALQGVGLAWMSEWAVAGDVTAALRAFIDVIHELSPPDDHAPD